MENDTIRLLDTNNRLVCIMLSRPGKKLICEWYIIKNYVLLLSSLSVFF